MVRITEPVRTFVQRLQLAMKPQLVLLFGSRATGHARASSDYDLLIVSPKFKGLKPHQRATRVYRQHDGRFALEVVCLTPAEYSRLRGKPTIVQEAERQGIVLYRAM